MVYQYQITLKDRQKIMYSEICSVVFEREKPEPIKEFGERYDRTEDTVVFLEQLLALFTQSSSPQDQLDQWSDLSNDQLRQKVQNLLREKESLKSVKQELEKQVSELLRTRENQKLEKLQREKAELESETSQLVKKNRESELKISQLEQDLEGLNQQLLNQQTLINDKSYQQFQQEEKILRDENVKLNRLLTEEKEKSRREKAELESETSQLVKKNRESELKISQLEQDLEGLNQQLLNQQALINVQSYQQFQQEEKILRDENVKLNRLLTEEKEKSRQYYQYFSNSQAYIKLSNELRQIFPQFSTLDNLLDHIALLKETKDKLQREKQNSDRRVQEAEQELQETQQKLSLATSRLRSLNIHSELSGGGSRSDQLKSEFSNLKSELHTTSSKVLRGWQSQGFESRSKTDFKSEEFFAIKATLSQRIFGDGMDYFTKDKAKVDAELHLVMNALSNIEDFNPTPAIFQGIQEKVQAGLLRSVDVDYSDNALMQYIEDTTQRINQDLQLIADFSTTAEALNGIRRLVELGLKIVRNIVNDPNSGELFIPENGTAFDENAHDTRDDHKGQITMTIYPGYRIKETVLVKADVITLEGVCLPNG